MVFSTLFVVRIGPSGKWKFWGVRRSTDLSEKFIDENNEKQASRHDSFRSDISQITEVLDANRMEIRSMSNSRQSLSIRVYSLFCFLFCCCFPTFSLHTEEQVALPQEEEEEEEPSKPQESSDLVPNTDLPNEEEEDISDVICTTPHHSRQNSERYSGSFPHLFEDESEPPRPKSNESLTYLRGFSTARSESRDLREDVSSPYFQYHIMDDQNEMVTTQETTKIGLGAMICRALVLIFIILMSCLIILLALASFYVSYLSQAHWNGEWIVSSSVLTGKDLKISHARDTGFTHVQGHSTMDVLFGQGFAHAQDRFIQMELYRRMARGTLSEVIGASTISSDILSR
jgi:hypothetical protein